MAEMPAMGADAEGDGARAPAFVAMGERFTSTLPRIAGSDLRDARAAAPSAAAVGAEAKDAAVAAMGGMEEAPGAAMWSADQAPTYLAEGWREGVEGRPDPAHSSKRTLEEGDQAGGGSSAAMDAGRESALADFSIHGRVIEFTSINLLAMDSNLYF
jgi:hypothetical protein